MYDNLIHSQHVHTILKIIDTHLAILLYMIVYKRFDIYAILNCVIVHNSNPKFPKH
jgi:hypothetical protein